MAFSVPFYFLLLALTHFLIQQPSPFLSFFNLFRRFHFTTVVAFLRLFIF